MQISAGTDTPPVGLDALFADTFTASEGAEEGAMVGGLVRGLLATTPEGERRVFVAHEGGLPLAAALFTRLHFADPAPVVFLLSPMAVATARQGQGLGQALLRKALADLRAEGAEAAITYGDPAFYGRVGFHPLTVDQAPPPQPLSLPQGWIGESLTGAPLPALRGPSRCAPALDDPAFW